MNMVLLCDPRVVEIPIRECGEPLVDVREVRALRLDGRLADPAGAYARLRAGVVDRLVTAQTLLPPGIRLLIVEGYRPLALQQRYFDEHVQHLRDLRPGTAEEILRREASRYISPPEVAPHVAGAAVDLTLCTLDGHELPLGTEVNDTDTTACHTESDAGSEEANANRAMLSTVLRRSGLVNYPSEWWHWSYGDRYWAFVMRVDFARYGPLNL